MHKEKEGLEEMGEEIVKRIKAIAGARGLEVRTQRLNIPHTDVVSNELTPYSINSTI